jgi:hypothetical protein
MWDATDVFEEWQETRKKTFYVVFALDVPIPQHVENEMDFMIGLF